MKKGYIYIFTVAVASIFIILIIFSTTMHSKNGFYRKFIDPKIKVEATINLSNNWLIAYETNNNLFLKSRNTPFTLTKIDTSFSSSKKIKLTPPPKFNKNRSNYYFGEANSSTIITNEVGEIVRLHPSKSNYFYIPNKFDSQVSVSPNTIFVRTLVTNQKENRFEITKIKLTDSAKIVKSYILPKQIDGFFCADGKLKYDKDSGRLYYMYYYRGTFLCLDTNLNLIYKAKTIDTISTAKLGFTTYNRQSAAVKSIRKKTTTRASVNVNRYFALSDAKLYIYSALKAENETEVNFIKNSPIDVYSAKNGKYLYSFSFPRYQGRKLGEFSINENIFLVLYNNKIVKYSF